MIPQGAVPATETRSSLWSRKVENRRDITWRIAQTTAIPILAFLGPLLAIVAIQCQTFGCGLLLGWDSSAYAWWAAQVQQEGALTMVLRWNYPNLYVLLLSGFGSLIGSVSTAEHILPIVVSLPLGYSYYFLTHRITGNRRIALFAAFLGGLSISTLELVTDLQRNLLTYGISLPLGASIYTEISTSTKNPRQLRTLAIAVWLPLLLVVLSTQLETYGVLAIAVLLGLASSRNARNFARGLLLFTIPVLIASPLMMPYFLRYGAETSKLIPMDTSDAIAWAWLYFGQYASPLIAVGIVAVVRAARNGNLLGRYLLSWLGALVAFVLPAILISVPPARLILMVPTPVLMAAGVPILTRWVGRGLKVLQSRMKRGVPTRAAISNDAHTASTLHWRKSLTVLVAFLVVATPVMVTTALNKDLRRPYATEDDVQRLAAASALLRQQGYREAIIIMWGPDAAYFAPVYRAYFGIQMPNNFAYYGKLQFIFSLPEPDQAYVWKYSPRVESTYATSYREELLASLGTSGVESLPIVVAGGATYSVPASETFLSRFQRGPGIYLIPPHSLTPLEIDTWRLYAAFDCLVCDVGSVVVTGWSLAPRALEHLDLSGSGRFDATYAVGLARGWSGADVTIRFWDWPANMTAADGRDVRLAPLELYVDGTLVLSHPYSGLGAHDTTARISALTPGVHHFEVKSGAPNLGVAVALDQVELVPTG